MLGADGLAEVVEAYVADTPEQLQAMRRALDAADAAGMSIAAHSLKGSSAMLGAQMVSALCGELEHASGAGSLDGASEAVSRIERVFEDTRAALAGEIGQRNDRDPSGAD